MRKLLLAGVAAAAFSTGAQAALQPIVNLPNATGPMTVVFVFQDADDESTLSWNQGAGAVAIIDNQADPRPTTVGPFGAAGPVTFTLENITQGITFTVGTAVAGVQHFVRTNNFADFGVGPLSAASAAAIAAAGPGFFVGVEDRTNFDNDFNDLIYWFTQVAVPGPAALGLFGIGLLGLAALRRRG
jgi:hypothetical protein